MTGQLRRRTPVRDLYLRGIVAPAPAPVLATVPAADIIDILDAAIDLFRSRYDDCADCRRSPSGVGRHCADHDEDQRLEHAARQLRAQYTQKGSQR